ncbi:hypothetical protein M413DRAFT_277274 [Hebeloma cylindrosporum]|uniref:Uncharacterized protein n=1 Tax=Hebeloma cylindrosporum TaxID=76867 RepID=A0A0C2XHH0_HEBCY|nr:hypothetical protein M413DRAFT_277274 [Hebeloma cylindrosporum h7]
MSLDDPNVEHEGGEAYFPDPAQAHNRDRAGSTGSRTTTTTTRGRGHLNSHTSTSTITSSSSSSANHKDTDMDTTPMPVKRISAGAGSSGGGMVNLMLPNAQHISTPSSSVREGETKELRDFWRAYMHTPLSDVESSRGTPLAHAANANASGGAGGGAGGYTRRARVASLPSSKTPIVEREVGDMGMMYAGAAAAGGAGGGGHGNERNASVYQGLGAVRGGLHGPGGAGAGPGAGAASQQHPGNNNHIREDLRSYEAAVMARKAPTTLNLNPRMVKKRGGSDANVRLFSSLYVL